MKEPIAWTKRKAMFRAFCVKQSANYVARICAVHHRTVEKYREVDDWDARLVAIKRRVNGKLDDQVADMLARQAQDARDLQDLAMARLLDGFAGVDGTSNAIRAFTEGAKIERVARGEPGERVQGSLLDELVARHRKLKDQGDE